LQVIRWILLSWSHYFILFFFAEFWVWKAFIESDPGPFEHTLFTSMITDDCNFLFNCNNSMHETHDLNGFDLTKVSRCAICFSLSHSLPHLCVMWITFLDVCKWYFLREPLVASLTLCILVAVNWNCC
jgi:hypothetical protein